MKKLFIISLLIILTNNCSFSEEYLDCNPDRLTKCKVENGKELIMLSSYAEKKYKGQITQIPSVPIVELPSQLKYPIRFPDGTYLGKDELDK